MKSVLVFALIVGVVFAGVFEIELTRVQSKRSKMIADGTWPAYRKYKEFMRMSKGKSQASQSVNDYDDIEYLGNVTLGTPQQQLLLILDTDSGDLIVPSSKCGAACANHHTFDSSKSSTFTTQGQLCPFQSVQGSIGQDTCCLGGTGSAQQLCIPKQTFCQLNGLGFGLQNNAADGILGLGFQSLTMNEGAPPIINAYNQHLLDQPIYTVWLTKNAGGRGGLFTYGALDTTNCGPVIAYQPLTSDSYWQFRINGVSAGSYSSGSSSQATSDTGSSFIGGPQTDVDAIANALGASFDANNAVYTIPCTAQPPDVVFAAGAYMYNINYKNYILDVGFGNGKCVIAFFSFSSGGFGPTWILGDPFIRSYCNVYDIGQKRIGFALPKN